MCRARATALRSCSALALTVLICLVAITPATRAQGPSWVEPRALSIVDIAGQVPDEALQGAFVSYSGLAGISQFTGSRRAADGLEIDVEMSARVFTENGQVLTRLPLLGVRPFQDHMSSAAPASTLFLFEDGQPLTADIVRLNYLEPALAQPAVGSGPPDRYPDLERSIAAPERDGLGIRIPANWGGELVITGDHPVITGTFRLDPLNIPRVTLLGTQEATFQSFIGDFSPGDEGILGELVAQIYRHCQRDEAHPRIPLNPPAGTNYVLFIYPPTPVDPYDLDPDRRNVDRPTTGTLRLAPDEAMLSINLVHSGGFPLRVAWQDADQVLWGDQVPGLPNPPPSERFLSLLPPIDRFTPPRSLRRRACRSTPVSAAESVRRRSSRTSALPTCPSASSTSRCKRRLLGRESPCSPCACPMMRGSPPFAPPAPRRRPRC
ncbi:MAG TPA: hypothetical protein GX714_11025 [Chloroflexi bacterium]|jgi:hypothetical protein|nr:hypothetical protein [Chloroflexota bacterium]